MSVSIWTEIIYDDITKKVISTQEFDYDRKDNHDWVLGKDQVLVRINKALVNEDISNKMMNVTLDDIKINPIYVSVDERKQAEINEVTDATDIPKLQDILLQMIEEKYT